MAHQMTLEEAAARLPELIRQGQEIILLNGLEPVAKLTPLGDDAPSAHEIAALAMAGGAFDWLADEPDLYEDAPADAAIAVRERLRQWQQECGLPARLDGQAHTPIEALFAEWDAEDSHLAPEEAFAEQQIGADAHLLA